MVGESGNVLADSIFLGRELERLSNMIEDQCAVVFRAHGVTIPVKSCSLILILAQLGTATAADLARNLEVSHQLVLQKIPKLTKLGLLISAPDGDDARKRAFSLTEEGHRQLRRFQDCRLLILEAYAELFAEVGDLLALISKTSSSLRDRSLNERIGEQF